MSRRRVAVLWLLATMALSTAFVVVGLQPRVPRLLRSFSDDFLHAAAYFVLALVTARTCQLWGIWAWPLAAFGWALLHGTGLELLQYLVPPRAAEWSDVAADAVGAVIGAGLAWFWWRDCG